MSNKNILKLTLDQLEVSDITDLGTILDKQDPQLSIKVGNKWEHTKRFHFNKNLIDYNLYRAVDKGVNATFPEIFQYEVSETDYNNEIEVKSNISYNNTNSK